MTVHVDFTQLDQPAITLSLAATPTGWYSVLDQHGQLYFPPTQDVTVCVRFMAAMAERKDALIDNESVERATWAAAYSVRVPDNVIPMRRPLEPIDEEVKGA